MFKPSSKFKLNAIMMKIKKIYLKSLKMCLKNYQKINKISFIVTLSNLLKKPKELIFLLIKILFFKFWKIHKLLKILKTLSKLLLNNSLKKCIMESLDSS